MNSEGKSLKQHQEEQQTIANVRLTRELPVLHSQTAKQAEELHNYQVSEKFLQNPNKKNQKKNPNAVQKNLFSCQKDDFLEQHIYSMNTACELLEHTFLNIQDINIISSFQENYDDMEEQFSEYLLSHSKIQDKSLLNFFLTHLERNQTAGNFLEQIYNGSPQIIMPELIYLFQKVFLYHQQFKEYELSKDQIQGLSTNLSFLTYIYNDQWLKHLNFGKLDRMEDQKRVSDLLWLMQFLIRTFLLVVENYYQNPFYEILQELEKVNNERKQEAYKLKKASREKEQLAKSSEKESFEP